MSNSGFKFEWNKKALKKISEAQMNALESTASKMISEKITQQEIPFKEGTLQNIQTDVDDAMLNRGIV